MNENCDHFIGYTFNSRCEIFERFYLSDNIKDIDVIDCKFTYCPICGEQIYWENIVNRGSRMKKEFKGFND